MDLADDLTAALADAGAVIGVGIDIEDIARFEMPRDLRLLNLEEQGLCQDRGSGAEFVAGRWCAKEAVVKSLATVTTVGLRDVSILQTEDERPLVVLPLELQETGISVLVSIAHSREQANAIAIARWSGQRASDRSAIPDRRPN